MNILNKKARQEAKAQAEMDKLKASTRLPSEVRIDYKDACADLGNKEFEMKVIEAEKAALTNRIFQLNQEYKKACAVHPEGPEEHKESTAATSLMPLAAEVQP